MRKALVAIAVLAVPHASGALPPPRDAWSELRTQHFVIYSNAGERRTLQVATELETMREVMRRVVPDVRRGTLSVDAHVPTQVYLFESARSFEPYRLLPGAAGFFTTRPTGNLVALDASVDEPLQVVRHEYLHHFLENNIPGVPLWANEGLAEFYSTMTRNSREVLLGRPLPHHVQWLRAHGPMPVEKLVALGSVRRGRRRKGEDRRGLRLVLADGPLPAGRQPGAPQPARDLPRALQGRRHAGGRLRRGLPRRAGGARRGAGGVRAQHPEVVRLLEGPDRRPRRPAARGAPRDAARGGRWRASACCSRSPGRRARRTSTSTPRWRSRHSPRWRSPARGWSASRSGTLRGRSRGWSVRPRPIRPTRRSSTWRRTR